MSHPNDYEKIAESYQVSDEKPDKLYSILPTVLNLVGDLKGKTVLDLGCGDGFFTRPLAHTGASKVIGIDNAQKQIELAEENPAPNVKYVLSDIFRDSLPKADVIVAPFVLNYAETIEELKNFFVSLYHSLNDEGKVVLVYDLPTGHDLSRFGALKYLDKDEDEEKIRIELYNGNNFICTLRAFYYKTETIIALLKETGFQRIEISKPLISEEGRESMGEEFWKGYIDNCELGYLTAYKASLS